MYFGRMDWSYETSVETTLTLMYKHYLFVSYACECVKDDNQDRNIFTIETFFMLTLLILINIIHYASIEYFISLSLIKNIYN